MAALFCYENFLSQLNSFADNFEFSEEKKLGGSRPAPDTEIKGLLNLLRQQLLFHTVPVHLKILLALLLAS